MPLVRVQSLVVSLFVLSLSGCLGDVVDPPAPGDGTAVGADPADVVAFALERLEQSHDHADPSLHAGTIGLERLSRSAPEPYRAGVAEGYFELALKQGLAVFTAGTASGNVDPAGYGGFVVFDVADPFAPREVARWVGQPLGDVELSDDGRFVFASSQRNGYPYPYALDVPVDGLLPRGVSIVDLGSVAAPAPETVGFAPLPPNGPHTITYHQMPDGRELLLACTYDLIFTTYPDSIGQNKLTQKVTVFAFEREPVPSLVPLSVFQILDPDEGEEEYFPHDVTVHVDPATDRVIASVAYWDMGLVTVDITDPANPVELARFRDTAPSAMVHTHQVRVFPGLIDGRVVAVMEPEIPTGPDTGGFTFVDLTDPAAPRKLAHWMLPGDLVVDQPFQFSPHNIDTVCGGNGQATGHAIHMSATCTAPMLLASHNHGGLWVLDVSDPGAPAPIGFHFGDASETGRVPSGYGTVFGRDGLVFGVEYATGLEVLRIGKGA